MTDPDVVVRLDAAIATPDDCHAVPLLALARDEIVALREYIKGELTVTAVLEAVQKARTDALEVAAQKCNALGLPCGFQYAAAIRALSDKRDE